MKYTAPETELIVVATEHHLLDISIPFGSGGGGGGGGEAKQGIFMDEEEEDGSGDGKGGARHFNPWEQ